MPQPIRLTITGVEDVVRKLRVLREQAPEALGNALFRFAQDQIEKPAKEDYVPVMFGALRSSIQTLPPEVTTRGASVTVSAGGAAAPYARAVHENPRSGRTGGFSPSGKRYKHYARVGQWKYLETPAIIAASSKQAEFAREAGVELDKVIHGLR
jgi:hypothetical protein